MMRRIALIAVAAMTALATMAALAGCGVSQGSQPNSSTQPSPTSAGPYTLRAVAGYFVPWDLRGVASLSEGVLTEVSPVWYQPMPGGQVAFASQEARQSVTRVETQVASHDIAILPTISNFRDNHWDGSLVHQIITDPQTRATHITAIVSLVQSHQWAGVDIDYESLRAADRNAYSAFIHDLAAALHQDDKRLTLTVHAKTAEPGDWSGARAQDWRALGQSADEVRVMAYDYSTENSAPGPIAPLPWVKSVLHLAVSEIPRDKIMLGVATYGYDWPSGQQGQDVQWADAEAIAQAHAAPVMWDPTSQSPWFSYTDSQGHPHTVWYENTRSLQAKLDLAIQNRIAGVVIWQLGGEDPAIWDLLRQAS